MGNLRAAIGRGEPVSAVKDRIAASMGCSAMPKRCCPRCRQHGVDLPRRVHHPAARRRGSLLIVVAMIAFLRAIDGEMVRHVHVGWVAALAAGALTWAVATFFIGISGASRELTEGFGSLFAAVVLLSVGIWMHGKSQAGEWQRYINETLGNALSRSSGWFLFGLAFIVVYREVSRRSCSMRR
jgi:high-affinity iron transporter